MRTCGAVALILLMTFGGCRRRPAPAAPPVPSVSVSRPIVREVTEYDEYPGRLAAVESVNVQSRVSGFLERAPFNEGALVKQGDLLFVIDARPFQAELDRAAAQRVQAEAQLKQAQGEFERVAPLKGTGAASEIDIFNARQRVEAAKAAVAAAQAAVKAAQYNVDWTEVHAPIPGRTGRKNVTPGNLVTGGTSQATLLTTITTVDPIYCYVNVDEHTVRRYQQDIREGRRVSVRAGGRLAAQLAVGEEANFAREGYIDFVDNTVDPETGTIRVRGVFPNPDGTLIPGFYARLRVPGRTPYQAVLVPEFAIGATLAQQHVLVVDAEDIVRVQPVTVGGVFDGMRAVEGLKPDARVVVSGIVQARPGFKVRPTDVPIESLLPRPATRPATAPATGPAATMPATPTTPAPVPAATRPATTQTTALPSAAPTWAAPSPSPRYSGERAGERGQVRVEFEAGRFADARQPTNRALADSARNQPLSPTLSPAYRGEGEVRAPHASAHPSAHRRAGEAVARGAKR